MLQIVGYDAHEPHSQSHGWIPRLVDNSGKVAIVKRLRESEGLLEDSIVIVSQQLGRIHSHGGDIIR